MHVPNASPVVIFISAIAHPGGFTEFFGDRPTQHHTELYDTNI
ncbi:hypothetical protein P7L53_07870 [Thermoleptolyngbya sichuanensis XZ-Cy5]|nr:hypothetical protein [Thermoleptolyngbya sichuanensis]MDG2616160.1 hypothetical protein [Thermoleptolyngbya sichuanensis XZ-Cy5]